MDRLLRGLILDLRRRCVLLHNRLRTPADPDLRQHALTACQTAESVYRQADELLADPSLGTPALLRNHLYQYSRYNEVAMMIEWFPLPFIERYGESDRRLTRLCQRLVEQAGWQLPLPLVAAFSNQYYWTKPEFGLICTPATEEASLLGLPDLCHELGHLVLEDKQATFLDGFLAELAAHFKQEQLKVGNSQRSPDYSRLYEQCFEQWRDRWVFEFVADMVATYLVGAAFGWQHVRLSAGRRGDVFQPSLGQVAEHPADDARLSGVVAVLVDMGAIEEAVHIKAVWARYLAISEQDRPQEYEHCYPPILLKALARHAIQGCRELGLRSFNQPPVTRYQVDITLLVQEAWRRFLADPECYGEWEQEQLKSLWHALGVSRPTRPLSGGFTPATG